MIPAQQPLWISRLHQAKYCPRSIYLTSSMDVCCVPHVASLLLPRQVFTEHPQTCQTRKEYLSAKDTNACVHRLALLGAISPHTYSKERRVSNIFYHLKGVHWHASNECQDGIPTSAHPLSFRAFYLKLLQRDMVQLMNRRQSFLFPNCRKN